MRYRFVALTFAFGLLLPNQAGASHDHGVGASVQTYQDRAHNQHRRKKGRKAVRQAAPSALVKITCGGKPVLVAASMASRFSGFCRELAATGYPIKFVGGWRPGTCSFASRHPCGGAIDINQTARDVCSPRCPRGPDINAMARRHGLLHGAEWGHADAGHFERLDRHSLARIKGEDVPMVERPHPLLGAGVPVTLLPYATAVEFEAAVGDAIKQARAYLIRTATVGGTMGKQTPGTSIGLLHPKLVERLAPAIREARGSGLPNVGCLSAYRMPVWGVGGYRNKFDSNHAYGLACDVTGIGRPGSASARLWHHIATRHGLYNPYIGTRAERYEWNHFQVTPTIKAVAAVPALRRTITARGPKDVDEMWRVANVLVDRNMGRGRRVKWAAAR